MDLKDVTLFGQSYLVYMALIMIVIVALKMFPLPKKVGLTIAITLIILTLVLLGYILWQVYG